MCSTSGSHHYDYADLDITVVNAKSKRPSNRFQKKFATFQSILGDVNNNSGPATQENGFRSINWDVGAVPFDMPGDFFSTTADRGLTVSSKYNQFRVSNPTDGIDDYKFDSINPIASEEFSTFSPKRLFTPVRGDNEIEITFTVPGTDRPAAVNGFGAIFVDVDEKDTIKMSFYDAYGCELYHAYVDRKDEGLSLLGVAFGEGENVVAKVVITLGNAAIDLWAPCEQRRMSEEANVNLRGLKKKDRGCPFDIVVLDDFTYGEPVEISQ
mmetsp:Transcript_52257/g.78049  ORF Transcript_52257/g.78049 Transcript_52257/m.78049 type:complete len:268 (-) Transcript_52257:1358-2161(-)|eukprot:CAMPEP_0194040130 /NCGR_PEP_ID=MMETSP0009_2-20130614/12177_1 /TAXON_ID=210454 /ORGANISM="Grammatophora oceanica, Strain CCMP 410" /LENGTH=267 /DNA_ID=CAMNT_0038683171 /DNA_START=900 /DNA_END=1703 /DNA_ORIENTATION=-